MVFLKLLTETDKKPSFLSWYLKLEKYLFYLGIQNQKSIFFTLGPRPLVRAFTLKCVNDLPASLTFDVSLCQLLLFLMRSGVCLYHLSLSDPCLLLVVLYQLLPFTILRSKVCCISFYLSPSWEAKCFRQAIFQAVEFRFSTMLYASPMHHSYPLQQFSLWNLFYFHVYQKLIAHSRPLLILFQLCRFYFFYLPLFGKQQ
jgi:hypothetical protein